MAEAKSKLRKWWVVHSVCVRNLVAK